jgi:hypothetical protein
VLSYDHRSTASRCDGFDASVTAIAVGRRPRAGSAEVNDVPLPPSGSEPAASDVLAFELAR